SRTSGRRAGARGRARSCPCRATVVGRRGVCHHATRPTVVGLAAGLPLDLGHHPVRDRHLESGEAPTQGRPDRGAVALVPLGPLPDDGDAVPGPLGGDALHARVLRAVDRLERSLDLLGEDLLAARVDHLAGTAQYDDRVRAVVASAVPGEHAPAARDLPERLGGFGRVLVVAAGQVAGLDDPADLGGVVVQELIEVVDQLQARALRDPRTVLREQWAVVHVRLGDRAPAAEAALG